MILNLFYLIAAEREREGADRCDYLLPRMGLITNLLWGDLGTSLYMF